MTKNEKIRDVIVRVKLGDLTMDEGVELVAALLDTQQPKDRDYEV